MQQNTIKIATSQTQTDWKMAVAVASNSNTVKVPINQAAQM
jgi:hypothetical protein